MSLIGIDLHSDSFFVVRTRETEQGLIRTERRYELHGESWQVFTSSLTKEDYVLIEATSNSFWFRDRILQHVRECFILNMHKIGFSGNKTDKIDAKRLVDVLSYYVHVKGISELPSVYVPRPAVRRLRSLLTSYRLNRRIATQLKNRIHSLFKQAGIVTTKKKLFTNSGWKIAMQAAPRELAIHVSLLCQQLVAAKKTGDDLSDLIVDLGMKTFPTEIELLLSIPGFSVFTAIVLLADIDNVDRFDTPKKFCAYLRTAPRVKGSNTTTHVCSTSRQSRSMTCSLLTQSVVHLKHAGPHFTSFYERVHIGKSAGKTRIALIRKILVSAYFMLKRRTLFFWMDSELHERKKKLIHQRINRISKRAFDMVGCIKEITQKSA